MSDLTYSKLSTIFKQQLNHWLKHQLSGSAYDYSAPILFTPTKFKRPPPKIDTWFFEIRDRPLEVVLGTGNPEWAVARTGKANVIGVSDDTGMVFRYFLAGAENDAFRILHSYPRDVFRFIPKNCVDVVHLNFPEKKGDKGVLVNRDIQTAVEAMKVGTGMISFVTDNEEDMNEIVDKIAQNNEKSKATELIPLCSQIYSTIALESVYHGSCPSKMNMQEGDKATKLPVGHKQTFLSTWRRPKPRIPNWRFDPRGRREIKFE